MYNPFSLEGKTVLITGASSGIGQATAIECSKIGATVIITARNAERLNETFQQLEGPDRAHRQIVADLTSQDDLESLVSQVEVLNGLVLCAGISKLYPFKFCTREKFNNIFDTNFFATVELLRLIYKQKKIIKKSAVVFVASVGGINDFVTGNLIYGSTKSALNSVMKFCALEFASKGIRVNSVNPGMVNTSMTSVGLITEEQYQKDMSRYPLKRYGEPNEIAYGIIYLLSDASLWVTGTSLVIDGGNTI